jgi:hypothetical protein
MRGVKEKYFVDVKSVIDGSTNSLVPKNLANCGVSSLVDSKYFWLNVVGLI